MGCTSCSQPRIQSIYDVENVQAIGTGGKILAISFGVALATAFLLGDIGKKRFDEEAFKRVGIMTLMGTAVGFMAQGTTT